LEHAKRSLLTYVQATQHLEQLLTSGGQQDEAYIIIERLKAEVAEVTQQRDELSILYGPSIERVRTEMDRLRDFTSFGAGSHEVQTLILHVQSLN
jgi:hypothetical protein